MENNSVNSKKVAVPNLMVVALAALSFVSLFLPWFSVRGDNVSLLNILTHVSDIAQFDSQANLLYLLTLIPVFSCVIIGVEMNNNVLEKMWGKAGKFIVFVVHLLALAGLIYIQNEMGGNDMGGNIFDVMGYGYWISIASGVVLFVTAFTPVKTIGGTNPEGTQS